MIGDAEALVERRKLKRKLTVWRVAAVVLLVGAVMAAIGWAGGFGGFAHFENHIARIHIDGFISGDQPTLNLIDEITKSDKVKAVIIRIDSPGGSTAGSEALYEAIRKLAKAKPVVAVMDTVAASGGYITAIAADHIVARGNTITGSIGVIFQFAEFSRLLDTLGIKMEEIKSGELKAEPSPFKPLSDKVRDVSNLMVQDSFNWFTGLVAERRQLPLDRVKVLADGRVYTGRQAVTEKLIDELGGEDQAVAWLATARQISADTEIVDWEVSRNDGSTGLGFAAARYILKTLGLSAERPQLDGLLAVWHPDLQ